MKKTVLVTGGAGYLGSQTVIELIRATEYEVISVDNFVNSSPETFNRIAEITGKEIINYNLDLCNKAALQGVFESNPDLIGAIHFAALKSVPESVSKPVLYYQNNMGSLLNLLDCCKQYNVSNFIFSSSCAVYGNISQLPVEESTPLNQCESPYAHTKFLGEEILKQLGQIDFPINSIALRYFNPVGGDITGKNGEDPTGLSTNLVPLITKAAIGALQEIVVFGDDYETRDGTCIRDYIHVIDIADAHIKALDYLVQGKNTHNFDIFNLGSGSGVTVLEAINAFQEATGEKVNYRVGPRRPGDVSSIYSNSAKAKSHLGWEPRHTLNDMMTSAWEWQKYHAASAGTDKD